MALKYAMACLSLVGLEAKKAFIIVDTQECFLENGSLPVIASQIIPQLNEIRNQKDCLFDIVVKTQDGQINRHLTSLHLLTKDPVLSAQDYHPAGHISFGTSHGMAPDRRVSILSDLCSQL